MEPYYKSGKTGEKKIALDTSMLLSIEKFRGDVFQVAREEFGKAKFFVPKSVAAEFENLAGKKAAKVADVLMKKNKVEVVDTQSKNADDALVELAERGFIVATNDSALRKRIKNVGGKIIYLKKKQFLAIN